MIVGALAVFVASYDPLCSGGCTGVTGVHGKTVTNLGDFTSPQGDGSMAYRVEHVPGTEFWFWFTLADTGPLGVTVRGIGSP